MREVQKETTRQANQKRVLGNEVDRMVRQNSTLEGSSQKSRGRDPELTARLREVSEAFKACLAEMKRIIQQQQQGNLNLNRRAKELLKKCKQLKNELLNHRDADKLLKDFEKMLISSANDIGIKVNKAVLDQPPQNLGPELQTPHLVPQYLADSFCKPQG